MQQVTDTTWLIIPPESPCGCGSGRAFGDCHLKDGKVQIASKNIATPGFRTNQSERKCGLKRVGDCGGGMSGDHIMSAAVLRVLDRHQITFNDIRGQKTVGVDSSALTTNWLCRRHNSALGPLDREAGRLVQVFKTVEPTLASATAKKPIVHLFSGLDTERWLLKTMCATYRAKASEIAPPHYVLPDLARLLTTLDWGLYKGLYVHTGVKDQYTPVQLLPQATIRLHANGPHVAGVTVELYGITLTLALDVLPDTLAELQSTASYRPEGISFFDGTGVIFAALIWSGAAGPPVSFSRGKPQPIPKGILAPEGAV